MQNIDQLDGYQLLSNGHFGPIRPTEQVVLVKDTEGGRKFIRKLARASAQPMWRAHLRMGGYVLVGLGILLLLVGMYSLVSATFGSTSGDSETQMLRSLGTCALGALGPTVGILLITRHPTREDDFDSTITYLDGMRTEVAVPLPYSEVDGHEHELDHVFTTALQRERDNLHKDTA